MTDEDIQNLLGGFATDTLTDRERELLFTASLTNQQLFNALADEQALREFLGDPASRRQLLQALQPSRPGLYERLTAWMHRPIAWAAAGSAIAALMTTVAIRQFGPVWPSMARLEPPAQEAAAPSPKLAEPAAQPSAAPALKRSRVEPMVRRDTARPEDKIAEPLKDQVAAAPPPPPIPPPVAAAPQPSVLPERENRAAAFAPKSEAAAGPGAKLKVAVLDFDAGNAPAKEADAASADVGKAASDLLGKKLDSSRYTVIDRKQVDKALQEQNLNRRQLDASTAAGVGRSVGADAVIVGSVTQGEQEAKKSVGAISGLRKARAKTAPARNEVQVSAQAINTQTATNAGVAFGQSEQTPGGGLARAVDQVASSLGQQIQQNVRAKIDGLVTDVNASILTLNVGQNAGVKVGDRLEVRRAGKPVGRVVISTVKDNFSVGAFEGTGPAKIGDSIVSQ